MLFVIEGAGVSISIIVQMIGFVFFFVVVVVVVVVGLVVDRQLNGGR